MPPKRTDQTTGVLAIGRYGDADMAAMQDAFDMVVCDHVQDIAGLAPDTRATITAVAFKGHERFTAEVLSHLPGLKLVANYGVGYDAIDVDACRVAGVQVTNTPDVLNDCVADLAVAMMLGLARQIPQGAAHVASGDWARGVAFSLNRRLTGRRVGILGLGRIGREIADRLAAFKCDIHYFARAPKDVPAGWTYHATPLDLARAVDDLVVATVGGAATRHMVDGPVIRALGADGTITNISRGSVIDEGALLDALELGRIRGAALDVFASEPDIDARFYDLDNVLLQPHQGSGTIETRAAMGALQRENIAALLAGKPLITPV